MDTSDHLVRELTSKVFETSDVTSDADPFDRSLWSTFKQTGLDKLVSIDDDSCLRDTVALLQDAGRSAARIPAAESLLANSLALHAAWEEESFLPTVVYSGKERQAVPWGRFATCVYFIHDNRVARLGAPLTILNHCTNLAGEPRDEIGFPPERIEISDAPMEPERLHCLAALFRAALMVGAMQRSLDIAVEHARNRVQFGKPIAKFQAVQQMIAQLAAQVGVASAAVDLAVSSFSPFTAAVAKSRASEAVRLVTDLAHQISGAMGFTEEFPLHRLTKRLWAWREENGSEIFWNRKIGARVAEQAGRGLWPFLSGAALQ